MMQKSKRKYENNTKTEDTGSNPRMEVSYTNIPQTERRKSLHDRLRRSSVFQYFHKENTQNKPESVEDLPLVCSIDDSPYKVLKVAGRGNLQEFEKLYNADPSRLSIEDSKGQMAIHMATIKGRINILEFIVTQGGEINAQDKKGNTALHHAVENEQIEAITFLLDNGADDTKLNEMNASALHLSVEIDNTDVIETMLKHSRVNPNVRGDTGARPLHYAAFKDRAAAAELLLRYGAKPCVKCDNGFYPIHCAAKSASANTMEVLIQAAIAMGYKRENIMSFKDKENNMPLHSAVHGGDIKAVEVCLKAGAFVNTQQDDMSTPLHFASAQGNLEMLETMEKSQPDKFKLALHIGDVVKRTPLHRAALFNHSVVARFLLEKGVDVDAVDSEERTPLLLAASKGGWATVQVLMDYNATLSVKDKNNRNFLHLAIKFGGQLKEFQCAHIKSLKNLLNEKDDFGCTPLHYASKEGHLLAIDDLIKMGASINPKNNHRESPFHFAARYGRYNTCKRLLESDQGPNILNETDASGMTGLHLAALNGHTKVLQLLMAKGSVVNRDNKDNSPLHYAASNGYTQSIRILLSVHGNLLDTVNMDKDTALHCAAKAGQSSAVLLLMTLGAAFTKNAEEKTFVDYLIDAKATDVALNIIGHDRWQEVLQCCSGTTYGCPMLGFIQQLPEVCMAVLDRCQIYSDHDRKSKDLYIEYNFKYLRCEMTYMKTEGKSEYSPLKPLNTMVTHGRVECLSHPVVVNFLQMKWDSYGKWFYTVYLLVYAAYLGLLSSFVVTNESLTYIDHNSSIYDPRSDIRNIGHGYEYTSSSMIIQIAICIYCSGNIVKEIFQMITQRKKYFADPQNYLEWTLYVLTLLFLAPFLLGHSSHWQWDIGALSVFLAWFNCLVFLQRFDFFGIYIVMFLEILRTLVQVICVFSILIIAFGLSFYILLNKEESKAYSTAGLSLYRTVMMMFELDYMESFNRPFTDYTPDTLHYGKLTFFMLGLFVVLMPILLMNLLIGLAVGDIESVQRNARLKRLAMQVEMHTDLERKMPESLFRKIDKICYRIYPNRCKSIIYSLWSKMTFSGDEKVNGATDINTIQNSYIYDQLYKQRQKMKEVTNQIDKNHSLLRLIVQKMEIHTEDDVWDEGLSPCDSMSSITHPGNMMDKKWRASIDGNTMQQTAIIKHWQKYVEK